MYVPNPLLNILIRQENELFKDFGYGGGDVESCYHLHGGAEVREVAFVDDL